jgi:hypothetical protein
VCNTGKTNLNLGNIVTKILLNNIDEENRSFFWEGVWRRKREDEELELFSKFEKEEI